MSQKFKTFYQELTVKKIFQMVLQMLLESVRGHGVNLLYLLLKDPLYVAKTILCILFHLIMYEKIFKKLTDPNNG